MFLHILLFPRQYFLASFGSSYNSLHSGPLVVGSHERQLSILEKCGKVLQLIDILFGTDHGLKVKLSLNVIR